MTRILGIDPGLSGAVALMKSGGDLKIWDMPTLTVERGKKNKRELDAVTLSNIFAEMPVDAVAYLEQVGAMPGQGVTSMFSFGKSYGIVIGILSAFQIPVTYVTPQKWKGGLKVRKGKDAARMRASELMPNHSGFWTLKKHDGRAEASLISYYGHQEFGGD